MQPERVPIGHAGHVVDDLREVVRPSVSIGVGYLLGSLEEVVHEIMDDGEVSDSPSREGALKRDDLKPGQ